MEPPSVDASPAPVEPPIVCRDQLSTEVAVNGEGFSPIPIDIPDAPKVALPDIELTRSHELAGADVAEPDVVRYSGNPDADTTNAFDADGEPLLFWDSRERMRFVVNQDLTLDPEAETTGVLEEGVWDVAVRNANGDRVDSLQSLAVIAKPEVEDLTPGMVCLAQGARTIELAGTTFLRNGDARPTLEVEGVDTPFDSELSGCSAIAHDGLDAEVCDSASIELAENSIDPGFPTLTLRNPETAACESEEDVKLRVVPPPSIDRVVPAIGCVDEEDRIFVIEGADFLYVDAAPPSITVGGMEFVPDDRDGCESVDTQGHEVERCDSLTFTIARDQLEPDLYDVVVANPAPALCDATATAALRIVPSPDLDRVEPALACSADGTRELTLHGAGFIELTDGEDVLLPAVTIDGEDVLSVDSVGDCEDEGVGELGVRSCARVVVTVAEDALLADSRPEVALTNPDPAGCTVARSDVLTVPPLLAIDALAPPSVCVGTVDPAFGVTITGTGFLRVGDDDFALSFDDEPVTPTNVHMCEDLAVAGFDEGEVEACSAIDATLDLTATLTASAGNISITVSNAINAPGCPLVAMTALRVVEPPTITAIALVDSPVADQVCSAIGFTISVTGTDFIEESTVSLVNDLRSVEADTIELVSDTEIEATFSEGLSFDASDPTYDLVIASASNCPSDPFVDAIEVNPTPLVFFVDPPVVYNEVTIDVTVFTSGLSAGSALDTIELIGPDGADDATELTVVSNPKPNRIVANIPGETGNPTFAAGDYVVRVTSVLGCAGELDGGFTITDTVNDALLDDIDPHYVSSTVPTPVTVTGSGFLPIPRLYLTPAAGGGTATALRAVELSDSTQLTAVVPEGLTPGEYHLVLVNPDGQVDVLGDDGSEEGVTVTSGEPPVIHTVVPASLITNTSTGIELRGENFDDTNGVEIELHCRTAAGATIAPVSATAEAVPDSETATATVSTATVPDGSICLVRLINDDGAYNDYSALSITDASLNLSSWTDTPDMTTGRRALSLVAGRPTNSSRFLYAIGGDSGVMSMHREIGTVLSSVEAVPVGVYGDVGNWVEQRNALPEARTWAGVARIGRFVYLTGGHDGTSATGDLHRSQILDPLATPEVTDLDAVLGDGTSGLGGGLYYYRVAAVFAAADANNPGGESLPGETLPVQLPDRDEGILLTLEWSEVADAVGYRIYRSPAAGDAVDAVELLTELTCGDPGCDCTPNVDGELDQCRLTDDDTVFAGTDVPMPQGSLGVWHAVDGSRCDDTDCLLGTAREAHATVAVEDASAPGTWYLYAFGGRDSSGTYLDTYEIATVTVAGDGSQTVEDWVAGTDTLGTARAELSAFVMTGDNALAVSAPDVWIYIGPGRTAAGLSRDIDANTVGAGGDLGTLTALTILDTPASQPAGYGVGAANDQLFIFGGGGGAATAGGISATLCGPRAMGACGALPDLGPGAWNALGDGAPSGSRIYAGSTQESAFFFLAGGHDGTNTLDSTERTVQ